MESSWIYAIFTLTILILCTFPFNIDASAHVVPPSLTSREVRVEDETFSADQIIVGQDISIEGRLASLHDRPLLITPSVDDGVINPLQPNWEILEIHPLKSFDLEPSEVKEFKIKVLCRIINL